MPDYTAINKAVTVDGPQGPQGATGPSGAGPTGPTGPQGAVSTATGPTGPQGVGIKPLTDSDKNQTPSQSHGDGYDTGVTISKTPDGYVMTQVDGVLQELGNGSQAKDAYFASDSAPAKVAGRSSHHLFRLSDKIIWSWGNNTEGGLADGTASDRSSPVSVVGNHEFVSMAGGFWTSLFLKSDGTVWSAGYNQDGTLGDNTDSTRSSPVSVVGAHSFVEISAGSHASGGEGNFSAARKASGEVWSWGRGNNGTLGTNETTNRSSPVSVVGGHSFVKISCGYQHSAALKSDGAVWTWGWNSDGVLGDNTNFNRSSPISVVGAHSFVEMLAGDQITIARKSDGSVWAWGDSVNGKLGNNNNSIDRSSPISVIGGHSFIQISTSNSQDGHSSALKADGSLWGWGVNAFGQLGDNSTTSRSSPVSTIGGHNFIEVVSGAGNTLGRKVDGGLWSFGATTGDDTASFRSSPVSVAGGWPVARATSAIQANDKLIWNGEIAGFDLDSNDRIDLDYVEE